MTIPVELKANAATAVNSSMRVTPVSLAFSGITGTDPAAQYVSIQDSAGQAVPFTSAVLSDAGWLRIDPLSSTTPALAKVTASAGVPAGTYLGSIVFTSVQTGAQQTVDVTYKPIGRTLSASPSSLTFTQSSAGADIPVQQVQISSNALVSFNISSQPSWVKITPSGAVSGYNTPTTLTVAVVPSGMPPGMYAGSIVLNGSSSLEIPVSLVLATPDPPAVAPTSISFNYALGSPPPAAQSLRISSPNGQVGFTVGTSTTSGTSWLLVNPTEATTPGTIAVSIDISRLVPGTQTGTIVISFQDPLNTILKVPVTLTVTGSTVQVLSILNGATWGPTNLAPGEIVTIVGSGFGPAHPVIATATMAGAYGTSLAGVTVFFDQIPAPLLMAQDTQINAVVPYAVYGRSTSSVQVQSGSSYSLPIQAKVVSAAPGLFTISGLGKGGAAALNADYTLNSPLNPAPTGSVIMLYLTGEGQTDPQGQDGRVIAGDLRKPLLTVTARIGGLPATVLYAGSAPGSVSGLCQVNLLIPDSLNPGTQGVDVQIGGVPSQEGVTIAVR